MAPAGSSTSCFGRSRSASYSATDGVTVFTIVNAGRRRDRGAEFDISTPLARRVKLMASLNLFDQRMPATLSGSNEELFRYTANGTLEWDGPERGKTPGDTAQLQWIYNSPWRQFQLHYLEWNQLSASYTHSFSRTLALTGTLTLNGPNSHRLAAALVQEYYTSRSPAEFKIKLLKTFGSSNGN